MKSNKPFACGECGKQMTYGQAQAAQFRGCPKCGGSDVVENDGGPVLTASRKAYATAIQNEIISMTKGAA